MAADSSAAFLFIDAIKLMSLDFDSYITSVIVGNVAVLQSFEFFVFFIK